MSGKDRGGSSARRSRSRSRSRFRNRTRNRSRSRDSDRLEERDRSEERRDLSVRRSFDDLSPQRGRGRRRERDQDLIPVPDFILPPAVVVPPQTKRKARTLIQRPDVQSPTRKNRKIDPEPSTAVLMDVEDAPEAPLALVVSTAQKVRAKQRQVISSELAKLSTDRRKYAHVQSLADALQAKNGDRRYNALNAALRGFFVKNAPLSANTVAAPAEAVARGVQRERVSRRLDRDFTGGLLKEFRDPEAAPISYHRTTGGDDHFWRDHLSDKLKAHFNEKIKAAAAEAGTKARLLFDANKTLFSSFDVELVDGKLQSTYVIGLPITNPNFLSARSVKPSRSGAVNTKPRTLTAWQNKNSVGAQSRANQAGMLPNLIQAFSVLSGLDDGFDPQVDVRTEAEIAKPFSTFTLAEKVRVFDAIRVTRKPQAHKEALLTDRRQLVVELGNQLNAAFKAKHDPPHFRVLLTKDGTDTDGLKQYPALIIELTADADEDATIPGFLHELTKGMQAVSPISIANRQSFGFVAPSISELGSAVRVWPGLIPAANFKKIVTDALVSLGKINEPIRPVEPLRVVHSSPLSSALRHAQQRANSRYLKEKARVAIAADISEVQDVQAWVDNRVVSNLIKAADLITRLESSALPDDVTLARAIRTLENLNEYDVLQAGVEEARIPVAAQEARNVTLLGDYERTVKAGFTGDPTWQADHVRIMGSGMAAYRSASAVTGLVRKPKRVYFEIDNLTGGLIKNKFPAQDKLSALAMVAQIKDLAYNFTSKAAMDNDNSATWAVPAANPKIVIYDITNSTAQEALADADQDADFVVMYDSLSKHYQLGADKTTLGKLMVFSRKAKRTDPEGVAVTVAAMNARFGAIQHTPLHNGYLNYMNTQEQVHEDKLPVPVPVAIPAVLSAAAVALPFDAEFDDNLSPLQIELAAESPPSAPLASNPLGLPTAFFQTSS